MGGTQSSSNNSCYCGSSREEFSKFKLRSSMAQERLSGLSVISINHDVSQTVSFDAVIDNFSAKKTRRVLL